jgi:hypothetical protein
VEIPASTYDTLKALVPSPCELAVAEEQAIAATLTGVRPEGAEVTLTLACTEPRYGYLAARLRSPIALTVAGERVAGRIVAAHPSGVNTVELTAELR